MANFTPLSAAIGGALIGLSAVLLMLLTGRIAGISGIFGGLLNPDSSDRGWRIAFIAGLILAPLLAGWIGYGMPTPQLPSSWTVIGQEPTPFDMSMMDIDIGAGAYQPENNPGSAHFEALGQP